MSISEIVNFDKEGRIESSGLYKKLYLALVIVLVAALSFGLGCLSAGGKRGQVSLQYDPSLVQAPLVSSASESLPVGDKSPNPAVQTSSVYASSKGKRYYFTNCSSSITEKNKITFASPAAAEAAGYTLAANCKAK